MPIHGTTQAYQDIYGPKEDQNVSLSSSSSSDDNLTNPSLWMLRPQMRTTLLPLVVMPMRHPKSRYKDFKRRRGRRRKRLLRKKLFRLCLLMVKTSLNSPRLGGQSITTPLMIGELTQDRQRNINPKLRKFLTSCHRKYYKVSSLEVSLWPQD